MKGIYTLIIHIFKKAYRSSYAGRAFIAQKLLMNNAMCCTNTFSHSALCTSWPSVASFSASTTRERGDVSCHRLPKIPSPQVRETRGRFILWQTVCLLKSHRLNSSLRLKNQTLHCSHHILSAVQLAVPDLAQQTVCWLLSGTSLLITNWFVLH